MPLDPSPHEHEEWPLEGTENWPSRRSSPVMGGPASEAWENSVKVSSALWNLMFAVQELSKMIDRGLRPFGTTAVEDLRLMIAKLERIAKSFEDTPC